MRLEGMEGGVLEIGVFPFFNQRVGGGKSGVRIRNVYGRVGFINKHYSKTGTPEKTPVIIMHRRKDNMYPLKEHHRYTSSRSQSEDLDINAEC